jgi:hypothetical protein
MAHTIVTHVAHRARSLPHDRGTGTSSPSPAAAEANLVLEFDGGAVHRTTKAFHEDRKRDRALATKGIHVVRATDRDEPSALAAELMAILAVRRAR